MGALVAVVPPLSDLLESSHELERRLPAEDVEPLPIPLVVAVVSPGEAQDQHLQVTRPTGLSERHPHAIWRQALPDKVLSLLATDESACHRMASQADRHGDDRVAPIIGVFLEEPPARVDDLVAGEENPVDLLVGNEVQELMLGGMFLSIDIC